MSSSHFGGPPFRRSISFVENWIAELVSAREVPVIPKKELSQQLPEQKTDVKNNNKKNGQVSSNNGGGGDVSTIMEASSMSKCYFVIGKVVDVQPHPESQKLYIEQIDLGEAAGGIRTILSGLQEHIQKEEFINRLVLVIANLEPRKIGGIVSEGMVLCASYMEGESRKVTLLNIPEGTHVGERVVFEGHDGPFEPILKKKLAKHYEKVAVDIKTNEKGEVVWGNVPFRTSHGVITAPIINGIVS